ncbi:MAG: DNA primase [Bacilli bacterium]
MDDKVNEIRKANDIVDVISSYLPLTKKGKNYFGVCPFHDDTNPSMSVSSDKQIYKCFSCGASGNVITFVMDYENVDFKEALSILAKRKGIDFNTGGVKNTSTKFDKYYKMYDLALKLYQNNINSSLGWQAIEYLEKRSISKDLIKEFKIGLALDKDALTKVLTKKDYSSIEIEKYGLGTGFHDLYFNRIMFPLFDTNNRVIGFSGRIYNTTEGSKYINTKETPIFKKGEILYNYYNAKEHVRLSKNVILVEGFMDVIRLYSIGIKNVVALMGTALTKEQINLLKRLSQNIYICLDGDSAGKKAALSVGEDLVNANCNVFVISLKEDLDPDEFILKYGEKEYRNLYENAIAFSEYKLYHMRDGLNLSNLEDKTDYINSVLKEVKQEDDEIKQEFILKKIALEFDIDINILKNSLKKIEKCSKIETLKTKPVSKKKLNKYTKATYDILYIMMNSYEKTKVYEKRLNYLPIKEARYLANEIIYAYKMNGSLVLADFITSLTDKEELLELTKEVLQYAGDNEANFEAFEDYMAVIREYNTNQEIKRLKNLMNEEIDPVKKAETLEKIRLVKIGSEI